MAMWLSTVTTLLDMIFPYIQDHKENLRWMGLCVTQENSIFFSVREKRASAEKALSCSLGHFGDDLACTMAAITYHNLPECHALGSCEHGRMGGTVTTPLGMILWAKSCKHGKMASTVTTCLDAVSMAAWVALSLLPWA